MLSSGFSVNCTGHAIAINNKKSMQPQKFFAVNNLHYTDVKFNGMALVFGRDLNTLNDTPGLQLTKNLSLVIT